jgi:hypothetical protein
MRLRDILNAKFDQDDMRKNFPLLEAIDNYVMSKRTPEEGKKQALAKLDQVLGMDPPANQDFALRVYLATRADTFVDGAH